MRMFGGSEFATANEVVIETVNGGAHIGGQVGWNEDRS